MVVLHVMNWAHLLRLLKINNFSMFSCIHFLSNRKQRFMSKRAQESKTEEGPAEAKPRPLSLVSRNLLSVKQTSSVHSGAWNRPGHQKLDVSSLSRGTGKPVRDSQDPTMRSQEWQQDDNPFRGARKLVRSGACESSGSTGKPVRGIA